jgi:hypothetical protein
MRKKSCKQAAWDHFELILSTFKYFCEFCLFFLFWLIFLLKRIIFERVWGYQFFGRKGGGAPLFLIYDPLCSCTFWHPTYQPYFIENGFYATFDNQWTGILTWMTWIATFPLVISSWNRITRVAKLASFSMKLTGVFLCSYFILDPCCHSYIEFIILKIWIMLENKCPPWV